MHFIACIYGIAGTAEYTLPPSDLSCRVAHRGRVSALLLYDVSFGHSTGSRRSFFCELAIVGRLTIHGIARPGVDHTPSTGRKIYSMLTKLCGRPRRSRTTSILRHIHPCFFSVFLLSRSIRRAWCFFFLLKLASPMGTEHLRDGKSASPGGRAFTAGFTCESFVCSDVLVAIPQEYPVVALSR